MKPFFFKIVDHPILLLVEVYSTLATVEVKQFLLVCVDQTVLLGVAVQPMQLAVSSVWLVRLENSA